MNDAESQLTKLLAQNPISVISLLELIIEEASSAEASDIHFEPTEGAIRVRLRVDGILHDQHSLPLSILSEIIARIKVLAGLRTDEHFAAQDGRFRVSLTETTLDIRVSIAPTYHGENAILRLLKQQQTKSDLQTLGFNTKDRARIKEAIKQPHGMILVTGPTGSGKTTTLYTLLQLLHSGERSLITLEDPVEYAIAGTTQININERTKLTFASGLRSILRQDPDIIMVGEIRDTETAKLAVNTALTGHLLLSTLHTNDAATTLPRLLDMEVDPYLISSTIRLVVAQRLVRRICPDCKVTGDIPAPLIATLQKQNVQLPSWVHSHGTGCATCKGSGYQGRLGIYEVLIPSPEMTEAVLKRAPHHEIHNQALADGMQSMFDDGMEKVAARFTTISEVLRSVKHYGISE